MIWPIRFHVEKNNNNYIMEAKKKKQWMKLWKNRLRLSKYAYVTRHNFDGIKKLMCKTMANGAAPNGNAKIRQHFRVHTFAVTLHDKLWGGGRYTSKNQIPNTKIHSPNNAVHFSNQNIESNSSEGVISLRDNLFESLLKIRRICSCPIGWCLLHV